MARRRQDRSCTSGTAATGRAARRRSTATTRRRRKRRRSPAPGYLAPAWSPDGRYIAATRTDAFGTDVVILDAERQGGPARHRRRPLVLAGLVAGRRRGRVPPPVRDDRRPPAWRRSTRRAGSWTVSKTTRPDEGVGSGRSVAPELVRTGVGAPGAVEPSGVTGECRAGLERLRRDRLNGPLTVGGATPRAEAAGPVSDASTPSPPTYLERLAARSAAIGTVLCLGLDPDPAGPATGVQRRSRRRRGLRARCSSRPRRRSRRPSSRTSPSSRPSDRRGSPRSSASVRALPADVPVIMDAKRGDIGSTAARQAVALYDGLGADAITVSPYLGEEAIAPLLERSDRFAYVLCRTSNPGCGRAPGADRRGG